MFMGYEVGQKPEEVYPLDPAIPEFQALPLQRPFLLFGLGNWEMISQITCKYKTYLKRTCIC